MNQSDLVFPSSVQEQKKHPISFVTTLINSCTDCPKESPSNQKYIYDMTFIFLLLVLIYIRVKHLKNNNEWLGHRHHNIYWRQ